MPTNFLVREGFYLLVTYSIHISFLGTRSLRCVIGRCAACQLLRCVICRCAARDRLLALITSHTLALITSHILLALITPHNCVTLPSDAGQSGMQECLLYYSLGVRSCTRPARLWSRSTLVSNTLLLPLLTHYVIKPLITMLYNGPVARKRWNC